MNKNKSKNRQKVLKDDLNHFENDWQKLVSEKKLAHNEEFLHKMADDIIKLNEDAILAEEYNSKVGHLIHHILITPFGAPFVCNKTLLEAALNYEYQTPIESDLCHIIDDFSKYSNVKNNELLSIFHHLSKILESENI